MKKSFLIIGCIFVSSIGLMAQDSILLCQNQVRAKQYETALKTCQDAAKTNAQIGNAGLGFAYAGLLDWANAVKAFTILIDADPRSFEAFANRGSANFNLGNYKAAYDDLSQAARIEPRVAARLQPQIAAAREIAELLPIKKAPTDVERRSLQASLAANDLLIGRSVKKLNKEPQANIDALDRQISDKIDEAIRINKHNAHAYSIRAGLYEAQGVNAKALVEHTKAIAIDPRSDSNFHRRGQLYAKMKNYPFAIADFTKAIELAGTQTVYYNSRSDAYEKSGQMDKALQDLTRAIELQPRNAFAYNMRASFYQRRNDSAKELTDLNKAIELDPKDANVRLSRCQYYNGVKKFTEAIADCTISIDQKSYIISDLAVFERAVAYTGLKKYALAIADLSKAESSGMVSNADIFAQRGIILTAEGKKAEAKAAFDDALKVDPKNQKALDGLKNIK